MFNQCNLNLICQDNVRNEIFVNEKIASKLIGAYKYGNKNDTNIENLLCLIIETVLIGKANSSYKDILKNKETYISVYLTFLVEFEQLNNKHIEKQKQNIIRYRQSKEQKGVKLTYSIENTFSRIKPISSIKLSSIIVSAIFEKFKKNTSSIIDLFYLIFCFQNEMETKDDINEYDKLAYLLFLDLKPYLINIKNNYKSKMDKKNV